MTCHHCLTVIPPSVRATVCSCDKIDYLHAICLACKGGRTTVADLRAAMTKPLSRERIEQALKAAGPELLDAMARGEA